MATGWTEINTRYAIIDPIIRALDWNTADPKECHPEYRRGDGWADYAFFNREGKSTIVEHGAPIIIIEAKALRGSLGDGVGQLECYTTAVPPMQRGLGL